jgi:hypothetical protein
MTKTTPIRFRPIIPSKWSRPLMAIGLGATIAAAPAAPPQAGGNSNPIIVQGERLPEAVARQRASQFVRATGVAEGTVAAARWTDAICPQVQGLADVGKRAAEAKMRSVATSAGMKVAPEGCKPNIVVSFTADGAALAREIHRVEPRRLGVLSPQAKDAMLTGSAPIRWMYSTEVRGRRGERMSEGAGGQTAPATHDGSGAGSSMGGDSTNMKYESSIISTGVNRVLTSAIVIIDTDQAMGRRLDALAAYAALVAFAEIRNSDASPDGSILGLFASSAPPRDLTLQDAAFLRALYQMPLDREAMRHRGQLVQGMTQRLADSREQ